MDGFTLVGKDDTGISDADLCAAIGESVAGIREKISRVLLIVPDITRFYSKAGFIANQYFHQFERILDGGRDARVDILVALGTHAGMTKSECEVMFGDIPFERFIMHNWREDTVKLGEVPAAFVNDVSEGLVDSGIDVEVNMRLFEDYDLILSIGQVVPHEVIGMANHSKNILVGCGGASMINSSHMLGALYGMERIMGRDHTPVRRVFDYAAANFLSALPIYYVLTVTTESNGETSLHGLYAGAERSYFESAVRHAAERNINFVAKPFRKVVVFLDPKEFKSTWLGNKAVYRTRMAIADGGELIILAPGVERFGEDPEIDALIRAHGYSGRDHVIASAATDERLQSNLSAAAHLIHGSSDGRFSVTYCVALLPKSDIEGVSYSYLPYEEAIKRYDPAKLHDGINMLPDGEEIFYISNPALGLWIDQDKFAK